MSVHRGCRAPRGAGRWAWGRGINHLACRVMSCGYQQTSAAGYFENARADVVAKIPPPLGRVLDVGCGAGGEIAPAAEIGTGFAAQAAGLRDRLGFALALTVWETIAWRDAYRWPRERAYRRRVLAPADRFLPTTERARDGALLQGGAPHRMTVFP